MIQIRTGLALLFLFSSFCAHADSSISLKSGDFTIQVDVRAQANLIYQLDCNAHVINCTSDVFERLWGEELESGAADRKALAEWRELRRELQKQAKSNDPTLPVKAVVPILRSSENTTWARIRWAEFGAGDADDLKRAWSPFVPAETAVRLAEIIDHFRPRFEAWWRQHEAEATKFLSGLEDAIRKARAAELLEAAARFYGSDLGDRRVYLHLFLQPKTGKPHTRATRIGAHITVEILPGETPENRVPVIIHELAHHVFGCMPAEQQAWLAGELLRSGRAGMPALNLFNEVQATVIGNMLAQRNVRTPERFRDMINTPQSFYADEAIDLGARATEKVFDAALKKGGRMTPSFARDYVAALQAGLGAMLETPALQLRSMALNADDADAAWAAKIRKALGATSVWRISPLGGAEFVEKLDRFAGLSAVVVARADQVTRFARASRSLGLETETLTTALGASRGAVLISERTPLAYSFVFAVRDDRALEGLIAAFNSCQLKPGVCVRIE